MAIQLRADWEIHIPLPLTISKVTQINPENALSIGTLFFATRPAIVGRNDLFERIG